MHYEGVPGRCLSLCGPRSRKSKEQTKNEQLTLARYISQKVSGRKGRHEERTSLGSELSLCIDEQHPQASLLLLDAEQRSNLSRSTSVHATKLKRRTPRYG